MASDEGGLQITAVRPICFVRGRFGNRAGGTLRILGEGREIAALEDPTRFSTVKPKFGIVTQLNRIVENTHNGRVKSLFSA